MKNFFISLFVIASISVQAQAPDQDPKAKAVLDEVSKQTKSYKSVVAEVVFTRFGKDKKQIEKPQTWKIMSKGDKFKLEIPGTTIVCDGKTLWNYNKDAREVTIKNFEADNDEQNPAKIFTMYENGYKYKYDKEEKVGTGTAHVIDLYPSVKPEKKRFHTVKIYSDKTKKQIVKMKMIMKDGEVQVYDVKSMKTNSELPDNLFVFDTKPFKADQINDER
jgi:outer membrane lipoprotein carrier protein